MSSATRGVARTTASGPCPSALRRSSTRDGKTGSAGPLQGTRRLQDPAGDDMPDVCSIWSPAPGGDERSHAAGALESASVDVGSSKNAKETRDRYLALLDQMS